MTIADYSASLSLSAIFALWKASPLYTELDLHVQFLGLRLCGCYELTELPDTSV